MKSEIILQVILIKPTPNVVFGLQKGAGNNYESVQKQISTSNDLTFTFPVNLKGDESKDKLPRLSGSFVQGSADNKFVYINIGTSAGQSETAWSRRLKIPLTGITWMEISLLEGKSILQTSVLGTGRDGGPNCAIVKPFVGWHLKQS
ncbi:hypothetical protein FEM33_14685 [Dyadobacter flavalbus]|uniref:Uncharacterized protein n=1 Tax=Dyadobacter flavalbus TaxID=2579942 RepID=A0A5M8QXN6_9BACT|nr:DUF5990 family protein [Dyadobacter flavalbus]KAA6439494.1 hypothetical protein FEM33_14685 [Dyadobacter flavalbus]